MTSPFGIFLLIGLLSISIVSADIYSCGGFVKTSVPVDYSKVQVKLLTPEGHLKHEEDCNPQNGYYMIPIYTKGQYSLKVSAPEGWFFEPELIDFKLNGIDDPCTLNEDINFVLSGFSIDGVVEGGSDGSGPSGLQLRLVQNGKVITTTTTTQGGKYTFKAPPGDYEVVAAEDASLCISRGKAVVQVKNGPVKVTPNLKISGYPLEVSVNNKAAPLANVPITVYSANKPADLEGCSALTTEVKGVSGAKFACEIGKTSSEGKVKVKCMPPGSYQLRASYKDGVAVFAFTPEVAQIKIDGGKSKASFSVDGFSATGRVVLENGKGFKTAVVTINGKQVATTDADGYYTVEKLNEGTVEISAIVPSTQFETVKANIKLPNIKIPDVKVTGFDVCGSVEKSSETVVLVLKNKETGDTVSIRPDSNGKYCKSMPRGQYTISPSDAKSALTPRSMDINLYDVPSIGLRFTYFKTDAEARVTCIGPCSNIQLTLLQGGNVLQNVRGTDAFTFKDIGPGNYIVRISDDGRSCWENQELPLVVERTQPEPVHFVQSGFSTTVKLSHPAKLVWEHTEKKQLRGEVEAKAETSICVPVQGKYHVAIRSCRAFDRQDFEINVPSTTITEVWAVNSKISGTIATKDNVDFNLRVKSSAGERTILVTGGVFSFQEPLTTSGDVILVPQSATHLFDPSSFSVRFSGECIDNAVEFQATKGIFIDGQITPAVEGVKVTASHNRDENVKFETISDKQGKYRVGPVRKAEDITISAQLDGYSFTAQPGQVGRLSSVKLSKLTVVVSDISTAARLDDVLLSVVGGKEYRSNNMIDQTGEINFVGLAPGEYFLRPILQEYKFEQSTTTIKIREGEHEHVELKGRRVAYSAFGRVRQMSGSSVSDVAVEALSANCDNHQSETITGKDGKYRIRGLKPNCEYRIATKASTDGTPAPHCFPAHFDVKMTAEDVKGLDMVAAPVEAGTDLAVEIDFGNVPIPQSYRVTVHRAGEHVAQTSVQSPVSLYYLSNLNRDGAEYSVRVEPEKPPQAFPAKTVFFAADAAVRVVRIPITPARKGSDIEIGFGSFMALPLFFIIGLMLLNQKYSLELISSFIAQVKLTFQPAAASPTTERRRRKAD